MLLNKKLILILGSHAHVPTGADEKDFEYTYEKIMRPFIANLYRYSNIHSVLHYSGVLLNWVERTHPEFFMLIEDMVVRKQAELLSGGFYEPMFPIISQADRIGQIEFMTTYLRKHFGKRPSGIWIPQMVWEQNMASSFAASDMQYTFLSHDQFIDAGVQKDELYFPCVTEDQGRLITVFPVSLAVEKQLAGMSFSQVFNDLKLKLKPENRQNDIIVAVFPEKITSGQSESPDTAWNRFFEEISLSENIVDTALPSKILKTYKSFKKVNFGDSASGKNKNFSPRRYIIDHCEAAGIYSKMVFTNVLINQLKGDKSRKQNAREELWKAQDSSLYMHCEGINKNKLRKAAYSSLIRAEQLSKEKGKTAASLIQYDFDFDGIKEYILNNALFNCYIQLKGAGIFELDYLPKEWNYLDCTEAVFNTKRMAFRDTLLPFETKTSDLKNFSFEIQNGVNNEKHSVRLCFTEQYDALDQDRKGKSCFKLSAHPALDAGDMPFGSIEITKCYSLKKDTLTVSYQLKNTGGDLSFCFIPEIDFSFADKGDEFVRFYYIVDGNDHHIEKELKNTSVLKILDVANEVQILITSACEFSGCLENIPENGQYQATRIMPAFYINLGSGKTWTNEFMLKFSH